MLCLCDCFALSCSATYVVVNKNTRKRKTERESRRKEKKNTHQIQFWINKTKPKFCVRYWIVSTWMTHISNIRVYRRQRHVINTISYCHRLELYVWDEFIRRLPSTFPSYLIYVIGTTTNKNKHPHTDSRSQIKIFDWKKARPLEIHLCLCAYHVRLPRLEIIKRAPMSLQCFAVSRAPSRQYIDRQISSSHVLIPPRWQPNQFQVSSNSNFFHFYYCCYFFNIDYFNLLYLLEI